MHALRRRVGFATDSGVTLVEMVVALSIIAIVATSFGLLMVSSLGASRTHEQRVTANQLGQNQLESVMAAPWSSIGLHSGDAGYQATVNSENTVTLSGASTSSSIKPTSTVTKSGVDYLVRTDITWTDDPNDGLGSLDGNSNTQDDKHVLVTVSWPAANPTRSVKFDDLRTPTATEAPPVSGSTFSVGLSPSVTTETLSSTGMFSSPASVVFTATTTKVASGVTLKYGTRDGQQHSVTMTNASGGTTWTATLGTSTGPFDTKSTTFSAAASTGSLNASGTTAVSLVGSGTSTATVSETANPSQTLNGNGTLSSAIDIKVTGSSSIASGTVTYSTTAASPVTANLTGSGTSWTYTVPADGTTAFNSGLEVFTVSVTFSDSTTRTATDSLTLNPSVVLPDVTNLVVIDPFGGNSGFCVDSGYHLYSSTVVQATVKNVATTDPVYLMAPAWMTAPGLGMSYLKTNADGSMVFQYTAAANSQLPNASSIQLQASASKTANGSTYSDNFVTSPNIAIYTASNKNKCT